jgi:AcrR family transcriptional regulator
MKISTRDRIVAEALSLFADKGYEVTTLNDIAFNVGIKTGSLYSHYAGKDAIFRAVLDSAMEQWRLTLDSVFSAAEPISDLIEGVAAVLLAFTARMAGSVSYRFWARVYVFPPPPVTGEDIKRLSGMDKEFGERLISYCAKRMPPARGEEVGVFCSILINMVMGMMASGVVDPKTLESEIKRNVAFVSTALVR